MLHHRCCISYSPQITRSCDARQWLTGGFWFFRVESDVTPDITNFLGQHDVGLLCENRRAQVINKAHNFNYAFFCHLHVLYYHIFLHCILVCNTYVVAYHGGTIKEKSGLQPWSVFYISLIDFIHSTGKYNQQRTYRLLTQFVCISAFISLQYCTEASIWLQFAYSQCFLFWSA